jgi:DNA-binding NarL/FixJ family response regulator
VLIGAETTIGLEGLRKLLHPERGIDIVGTATGASGLPAAGEEGADILLVQSGAEQGVSWCGQAAREGARPWVLLLGAGEDDEWAAAALAAGARGVLSRHASPADLVKAIQAVHEGQIWAASSVVAQLVGRLAALTANGGSRRSKGLSPREEGIVRLAAEGLSNKELASRLGISQATVKAHLTRVYQKLGVRDRVQLLLRYNGPSPSRRVLRR